MDPEMADLHEPMEQEHEEEHQDMDVHEAHEADKAEEDGEGDGDGGGEASDEYRHREAEGEGEGYEADGMGHDEEGDEGDEEAREGSFGDGRDHGEDEVDEVGGLDEEDEEDADAAVDADADAAVDADADAAADADADADADAPPQKKLKTHDEHAPAAAAAAPPSPKAPEPPAPTLPPFQEEEPYVDDGRAKLTDPISFLSEDLTLNAMVGPSNLLLSLADGGLQQLLAGARAQVGIRQGRFYFEVKVMEITPMHMQAPDDDFFAQQPQPPIIRVGFSLAHSSPIMGDNETSVAFDMGGNFLYNRSKASVCSTERPNFYSTLGVLLNVEEGTSNMHTLSLFKDGKRICQPQPLPAFLQAKALYPTVTYRGVTLQVNFGPVLRNPPPFNVCSLQEAPIDDVEVFAHDAADAEGTVATALFPVFIPDEGMLDWLDYFMESHPLTVEISERALAEWATRSGLTPITLGESIQNVPGIDNQCVRDTLLRVAKLQRRSVAVVEVGANLNVEARKKGAHVFQGDPAYRSVAWVLVGEPSDGNFKAWVRQRMIEEKEADLSAKKQATPKIAEDKANEKQDAAEGTKEAGQAEAVAVTLTPEEEKNWWKRKAAPKKSPKDLLPTATEGSPGAAPSDWLDSLPHFSLPAEGEGFDEVQYRWSSGAVARQYFQDWCVTQKLTTALESLRPTPECRKKHDAWIQDITGWKNRHERISTPDGKKALAAAKDAYVEELKQVEKEETGNNDENQELEASLVQSFEIRNELDLSDPFDVEDIEDLGWGEPLYSKFEAEDWAFLCLRFELHLLCHAFCKYIGDEDIKGLPIERLPKLYSKYYRKFLIPKYYGAESIDELLECVSNTIVRVGQVLESQASDDLVTNDVFLMLTEAARRDREIARKLGQDVPKRKILMPQSTIQTTPLPMPKVVRPIATPGTTMMSAFAKRAGPLAATAAAIVSPPPAGAIATAGAGMVVPPPRGASAKASIVPPGAFATAQGVVKMTALSKSAMPILKPTVPVTVPAPSPLGPTMVKTEPFLRPKAKAMPDQGHDGYDGEGGGGEDGDFDFGTNAEMQEFYQAGGPNMQDQQENYPREDMGTAGGAAMNFGFEGKGGGAGGGGGGDAGPQGFYPEQNAYPREDGYTDYNSPGGPKGMGWNQRPEWGSWNAWQDNSWGYGKGNGYGKAQGKWNSARQW